jgi:hypothetical protein
VSKICEPCATESLGNAGQGSTIDDFDVSRWRQCDSRTVLTVISSRSNSPATLLLVGFVASQASANLVSNGGFEGPTFPGTYSFLSGANDLPGWTFTGDLQGEASYWWKTGHGGNTRFAAEGGAALMLNNGDRISQTISTVVGES